MICCAGIGAAWIVESNTVQCPKKKRFHGYSFGRSVKRVLQPSTDMCMFDIASLLPLGHYADVDIFERTKPYFTQAALRNLVLERIAFLEDDQRFSSKEKRCKDQIVKEEVIFSQYDYFGRHTARVIDDVNALTDEISIVHQRAKETDTSTQSYLSKSETATFKECMMVFRDDFQYMDHDQIADAYRSARKIKRIRESARRINDVVNDLAEDIRSRKCLIGTEDIQLELDIIRKSTAKLTNTVRILRKEMRQEPRIVHDGDIAEKLGYIQWSIADLIGALKRLRTEMRENRFYRKPVGTKRMKRKQNSVVNNEKVAGDDANQHSKKTKHIATYGLAGEKKPTCGKYPALLCELCINENEAVNWCETCNSNICVSCTFFHKDVRMMMNHRIFSLP